MKNFPDLIYIYIKKTKLLSKIKGCGESCRLVFIALIVKPSCFDFNMCLGLRGDCRKVNVGIGGRDQV